MLIRTGRPTNGRRGRFARRPGTDGDDRPDLGLLAHDPLHDPGDHRVHGCGLVGRTMSRRFAISQARNVSPSLLDHLLARTGHPQVVRATRRSGRAASRSSNAGCSRIAGTARARGDVLDRGRPAGLGEAVHLDQRPDPALVHAEVGPVEHLEHALAAAGVEEVGDPLGDPVLGVAGLGQPEALAEVGGRRLEVVAELDLGKQRAPAPARPARPEPPTGTPGDSAAAYASRIGAISWSSSWCSADGVARSAGVTPGAWARRRAARRRGSWRTACRRPPRRRRCPGCA